AARVAVIPFGCPLRYFPVRLSASLFSRSVVRFARIPPGLSASLVSRLGRPLRYYSVQLSAPLVSRPASASLVSRLGCPLRSYPAWAVRFRGRVLYRRRA